MPGGGVFELPNAPSASMNESGSVLFSTANGNEKAGGLFLFRQGQIEKIAALSEPALPFSEGTYSLTTFSNRFPLNNSDDFAFSAAYTTQTQWNALLLSTQGERTILGRVGSPAPQSQGSSFANKYFDQSMINDSGEVAFRGYLCCGASREGIFLVGPMRLNVPNGDFEDSGQGELPAGWSTISRSTQAAEAVRYDSAGADSWTGNSALRLHVNSAGGSVFVQSDPIGVSPNADYLITSRMRYNLISASDAVRFSVSQLDAAGDPVGSDEVTGVAGDNLWSWQHKRIHIRTVPTAATVRIQFDLVAAGNSYLDVDSVR